MYPVKEWRYVPGNKNKAADLISKGCDMNELTTITEGPELLKVPFSKCPNLSKKKVEVDEEEKER